MNARISVYDRATNKQKAVVRELVEEEMRRQSSASMRRLFKLFCFCLNEDHGFGKVRLMRLMTMVSELAAQHDRDEVFWSHIDMRMQQIGIEFSEEDYEEMDR